MNVLTLATLLTGFTSLVTFIWLLARAFGKHSGWGMAVLLFSPLSATAYGIKYWKVEKSPFLAYISTTLATTVLCLYLFTSWGGWDLLSSSQRVQQGISSQTLSEQDTQALITISRSFHERSGLDVMSSPVLVRARHQLDMQTKRAAAQEAAKAEASNNKHLDLVNIAKKVKPARNRYRLTYIAIPIEEARNYVGSTVKVTRKNVVEKEYRLVSASKYRLEFSQRAGTGSYTFKYKMRDIEKIRVLTKQPG